MLEKGHQPFQQLCPIKSTANRVAEVVNAPPLCVLQNLIKLVHLDQNDLPLCSSPSSRSGSCSGGGTIKKMIGIAGSCWSSLSKWISLLAIEVVAVAFGFD